MHEQAKSIAITLLSAQTRVTAETIHEAVEQVSKIFPGVDRSKLIIELTAHYRVISHDYRILEDKDVYQPWVRAARAERPARFWNRYRDYLLFDKKMSPDTINQLDNLTDDILDRLHDPKDSKQFDRRGMVVGNVQSGKTSNYTGLVCKAADSGFQLIIVLTGIHSSLRQQTQKRIDQGFIGSHSEDHNVIGVGLRDPKVAAHSITTSAINGDFTQGAAQAQGIALRGHDPVIAIVKKNAHVLRSLINWLRGFGQPLLDGRQLITNLPMLLIDDEADNASINVSKASVSTINGAIRALLSLFEQRAYVGYTATPFANVFIPLLDEADYTGLGINIHNKGYSVGQDLFPRDFIINIPAPSNYIGPERMFGLGEPDDHDEEKNLLPVRIQIDDYQDLIPDKHKKDDEPPHELPDSLQSAVCHFILSCAARIARGQQDEHSSMLVHVTRFTNWQNRLGNLIDALLKNYQGELETNLGSLESHLQELWENEYRPVTRAVLDMDTQYQDPGVTELTWEEVQPHLWPAASRIEVRIVHGSPDRNAPLHRPLNYEEYERKDMKVKGLFVIAVGGDKLSRGLTLEGLCISYYLRASKMYDTLMQMGRWFGYRPGYVDLCRLFTSEELIRWYRHITLASEEMRRQFDVMAHQNKTPREYGLKVRTLPGVLQITATNKLRDAWPMRLSYADTLIETYTFARDAARARRNYEATNAMLKKLGTHEQLGNQPYSWKGVPAEVVLDFLRAFRTGQDNISQVLLTDYIGEKTREGYLTNWRVVLIEAKKKASPDVRRFPFPIGAGGASVEVTTTARTDSTPAGAEYMVSKSHIISGEHEYLDLSATDAMEALDETKAFRKEQYQKQLERLKPGSPVPDPPKEPDRPSGPFIRARRPPEEALLLLYPLDPFDYKKKTLIKGFTADAPVMGYAISFPAIPGDEGIEYMVNSQFHQEFDYPDELDQEEEDAEDQL
ncbi:MAG TPA: Z1 domain-containing protein [Hymenobacter sp.]|jgi:hypothetical protein|uniref:Z1 domain-containing protein n=1 Tax=Hymenobacter sp. TaxID=1898978 RepID=UPI002ED8752B